MASLYLGLNVLKPLYYIAKWYGDNYYCHVVISVITYKELKCLRQRLPMVDKDIIWNYIYEIRYFIFVCWIGIENATIIHFQLLY